MDELIRPIRVEARPRYHIYLEFADGTNGDFDLSRLVGKGVFRVWNDYRVFENVSLGDHREIKWDDEIELCADSLYLELTHKSPEELFPELQRQRDNPMPELFRFYVIIRMFWEDHPPPHFHASYGNNEALVKYFDSRNHRRIIAIGRP